MENCLWWLCIRFPSTAPFVSSLLNTKELIPQFVLIRIGKYFIYFQNPEDAVNYFDPDTYERTYEILASKSNATILDDKSLEPLSDSDWFVWHLAPVSESESVTNFNWNDFSEIMKMVNGYPFQLFYYVIIIWYASTFVGIKLYIL